MKKLALIAALAAIVFAPNIGRAVNGNVDVTARISPPLRIVPVSALDFGLLLPDGVNPGTSVITAAGVQTNTNLSQVAAAAAGRFDLMGRGGAAINTLTIAGVTLNCTPVDLINDCLGATTIVISAPTLSQTVVPFNMPAGAGMQTLQVSYGAQLDTAINQGSGTYSGVMVVTAAY